MLKHGVKWVTGTSVIIFCMWCYLFCSNNFMFASSYANVSQSWKNAGNGIYYNDYTTFAISFLYSEGEDEDFPFVFGFLTNQTSVVNYPYILAIYIETLDNVSSPVVVWCANRNHPVQRNAILNFTSQGDLVLRDADGSLVWSTNTSGLSVMSMELESNGNLVLSNARGKPMWESVNYPTDTLLYGQQLSEGQRLVSNNSTSNYSEGMYYASRESDDIHAFVDSNSPQQYSIVKYDDIWNVSNFIDYILSVSNFSDTEVSTYTLGFLMYVRLDQDGHLRRYGWNRSRGEFFIADIFYNGLSFGDCGYPTTCGKYGVCTNNRTCGCPAGSDGGLDFKASKAYDAEPGCTLVTPLSCPDTHKLQTFIKIENLTYFDHTPSLTGTDVESCKIACLSNCSCKAVFFRYYNDASLGNCTLPSELFTLTDVSERNFEPKTLSFIKVQNRIRTASKRKLVVSVSASVIAMALVTGVCYYMFILRRRRRAKSIDCSQDVFVDTVTRFSYESLVTTTQEFQTRLGRGGFGSVFQGTLGDGAKVAVKRLDSLGQGRKEFLAEVNTIGSIHHFNLVKLIGFCDDGVNRLLVYEYMCNGSLEKWIFNQDVPRTLTWNLRRRIIDGVASGLEYLHEHCNQNIIHFDIKPQNILLDKDFNVKISDFGLAKMVDRDHSQVVTIVRGTPGYMAPELITGRAISCKVDVYSFGVLVLEIVCGRKNFGSSEGDCLTNLVKTKADGDQLSDLIDEHGEDMMQQHKEEVVNMMKIAIWCLQPHFIRPTMSMVVKVLQDLTNIEPITDLSYLHMVHEAAPPVEENYEFSVRPTESLLSGPR